MSAKIEIIAEVNHVDCDKVKCKNCTKYTKDFGGFCEMFNVPTGSWKFCSFFDPIREDGDA